MPLLFNKYEVINEFKIEHSGTETTFDIIVLKYQKNFIKKAPFKVICENSKKQLIEILYFNMNEFQIKNYLKQGFSYRISGKLNFVNNKFQIIHPSNILKEDELAYFYWNSSISEIIHEGTGPANINFMKLGLL